MLGTCHVQNARLSPATTSTDLRAYPAGSFPDRAMPTMFWTTAKAESLGESTLQEHLSKAESRLVGALAPCLRLYASSTER